MKREEILRQFEPRRENIIGIFHALQNANPRKYLTKDDLLAVAEYLDLPPTYVYGVAGFYSYFKFEPRGKYVIRVCDSPGCRLFGSLDILEKLKEVLGIEVGETTKDGMFTLETTSCIGFCTHSPAMLINDEIFVDLTPSKIEKIIEEKRRNV